MSDLASALFGRRQLLHAIEALVLQQRNVLLVGSRGVGKTALLEAFRCDELLIIDPFEHVSTQRAWRIRRAMDRGVVCLAAARSIDRAQLGCVGRIVWRFYMVGVPPLSALWIRRLVIRECQASGIPGHLVTAAWMKAAIELIQGRPGVALAIVRGAAGMRSAVNIPAPAAAYLEAAIEPHEWPGHGAGPRLAP